MCLDAASTYCNSPVQLHSPTYQEWEVICAELAVKDANFIGFSTWRVSWTRKKVVPVFEAGIYLQVSSQVNLIVSGREECQIILEGCLCPVSLGLLCYTYDQSATWLSQVCEEERRIAEVWALEDLQAEVSPAQLTAPLVASICASGSWWCGSFSSRLCWASSGMSPLSAPRNPTSSSVSTPGTPHLALQYHEDFCICRKAISTWRVYNSVCLPVLLATCS